MNINIYIPINFFGTYHSGDAKWKKASKELLCHSWQFTLLALAIVFNECNEFQILIPPGSGSKIMMNRKMDIYLLITNYYTYEYMYYRLLLKKFIK